MQRIWKTKPKRISRISRISASFLTHPPSGRVGAAGEGAAVRLAWLIALACALSLGLTGPSFAQQAEEKKTAPEKASVERDRNPVKTPAAKKPQKSEKKEDNKAAKSKTAKAASTAEKKSGQSEIPDPKQVGGEPDGIVQVANLVYAGTKSSECFADHFLVQAEQDSSISTSRRFHAIKLDSAEIYNFPLVIMTGEGAFTLPAAERENLKRFVERGGFLLASAGCSSQEWDTSFRREMNTIFGEKRLAAIDMAHPVFHTVYDITQVGMKHGEMKPLEGISIEGRLGVLYSQDGLNDTAHTTGCCCCGGNEIKNSVQINVNILGYALTH